jgi:3-oxoacyl-[acyl-carrier-protein] synthase-1
MSPAPPVSIVGFAGCTSLGYSLGPTLAAMGAGLNNFTDTGVKNPFGTPVMAASLLDRDLPRIERLRAMTSVALVDLQDLLAAAGIEQAPLMLGVPSDLDDEEEAALRGELARSPIISRETAWFPYGRASAFSALAGALSLVERGTHPFVVVGGIDSLCGPLTVHRLVQFGRTLGPHTEGTIPGEAAVCALLARTDSPVADPASTLVLEAVTQHRSAMAFTQRDRVSGDDLATVFRAFRERGSQRVHRVIAAHSGEGYFGHSFAHAYLREVEVMPEPLEVELIADCVGDVGAAAGTLGLAFAMYRMATQPMSARERALVQRIRHGRTRSRDHRRRADHMGPSRRRCLTAR